MFFDLLASSLENAESIRFTTQTAVGSEGGQRAGVGQATNFHTVPEYPTVEFSTWADDAAAVSASAARHMHATQSFDHNPYIQDTLRDGKVETGEEAVLCLFVAIRMGSPRGSTELAVRDA
ncbi:hypothetical protein CF319_g1624 [Tilletia indica]|nr:hypothetical protein CF319_g1624 [Tilletia indica]